MCVFHIYRFNNPIHFHLYGRQHHKQRLKAQYGFHVAGEGGEYETLALDAPFFKVNLYGKSRPSI